MAVLEECGDDQRERLANALEVIRISLSLDVESNCSDLDNNVPNDRVWTEQTKSCFKMESRDRDNLDSILAEGTCRALCANDPAS